jgi:hypothetical protein
VSEGGSGGNGGSYNKVGALLLAAIGGVIGFIVFTGGGDNGGTEAVLPTSQPPVVGSSAPAATSQPSTTEALQTGTEKETLRANYPNSVVITITAFGMPARVGIEAQNDAEVFSRGVYIAGNTNLACLPDAQYPNPCVTYMVVQRGATVTVQAGNSRAGYWPILESLSGGGCDRPGTGDDRDITCTLTLFQDADISARYYGEDTPNGRYDFPKCPAGAAGSATSEWIKRCQ